MKIKILVTLFALLAIPSFIGVAESGLVASWYGGGEELNRYTANGEVFNPEELTCASWDYPFDTLLQITNLANQKTVVVRVNDRGPNKELGRAVDLTRAAFAEIADTNEGLVPVTIEKLD